MMELVILKLLPVVAHVPVATVLTCETTLIELSRHESARFVNLLIPFVSDPTVGLAASAKGVLIALDENSAMEGAGVSDVASMGRKCTQENSIRVVVLRAIAAAVPHLPANQLVSNLLQTPAMLLQNHVLPQFNNSVVDVRQAAVLLLVEVYGVIGDALYPYIRGYLSAAHLKLLTIYITKRNEVSQRNEPVSFAQRDHKVAGRVVIR
jgi:hypothetical protein